MSSEAVPPQGTHGTRPRGEPFQVSSTARPRSAGALGGTASSRLAQSPLWGEGTRRALFVFTERRKSNWKSERGSRLPQPYHITYYDRYPHRELQQARKRTTWKQRHTCRLHREGGRRHTAKRPHASTIASHEQPFPDSLQGEWAGGREAQTGALPLVQGAVCARNGASGPSQALRVVLVEAHAQREEEEGEGHRPAPVQARLQRHHQGRRTGGPGS